MENTSINTEKYSKIIKEIERFIETKKKKPTTFKGTVESMDLSNNILTIKLQSSNPPNLSRGSLVLIKEDNPESIDMKATIKEIYNSNVKLEIETDSSMFENKKVVIDTEKTNVILERLKNVIDKIKKGKINSDNVRILDILINDKKPKYNQKRVPFISRKLNDDQKRGVIDSIIAEDFHLIIGPPGTGKTYVIEELTKQFVKRKQKILITAWTNLAVDNIIKRLPKLRGRGKNFLKSRLEKATPIKLSVLEEKFSSGEVISYKTLLNKGIIKMKNGRTPKVKILADGEMKKSFVFEGIKMSESAKKING